MWEFPGGKIGATESAAAALHRELAEELGVTVIAFEHFMDVGHRYAECEVAICFFLVTAWHPEPRGLDGQGLEWVYPEEIGDNRLLAADTPVLAALRDRRERRGNVRLCADRPGVRIR